MSDLSGAAVAVGAAAVAGWVAGRRLFAWARGRCDEALIAARSLPDPRDRSLALVATLGGRPSRAQARDLRAVQQALDDERTDGALLARRAVRAVPAGEGDGRG